jgi:hypothetical protein
MFAKYILYRNIGLQRHIRSGNDLDRTELSPCLIPLHEVLSKRVAPEDAIKSYAAKNAVFQTSMKQINEITGKC